MGRDRGARSLWVGLHDDRTCRVKDMFRDSCTCIAIGETTTLMIYEDGNYCYTSGLTHYLYELLDGRQSGHSKPTYVALGSQDRYYVKFANGKSEWVGPRG